MGKDLHVLLQNTHKLPTPPPTNNPQYTTKKYRSILIHHLKSIENANQFASNTHEIFIFIDDKSLNINKPPITLTSPSVPAISS